MKPLSFIAVTVVCFVVAGCESVRSDIRAGMKEKFEGPIFRTRIVTSNPRVAYEAARGALTKMNFRFVRGGPAQGEIEALGDLVSSDALKRARQIKLQIKISPSGDGAEVAALFTEVLEGDFAKDADLTTERSLRETTLYDVLFNHIESGPPK